MQREVKKYLYDVKSCIENIETFIGEPKMYSTFEKNLMLQQAVERNIEIIGEAVNNLLKIHPEITITTPGEWLMQETKSFMAMMRYNRFKFGI